MEVAGGATSGRLLLVDDSQATLAYIGGGLEAAGWDVQTADSAAAALRTAEAAMFDVVVCDLHMPDVDGLELMRRLRAIDATLPVIILSGDHELPAVLSAVRQGAFDYVTKEQELGPLAAAVQRAAGHARVVRDNRRLSAALRAANEQLEERVRERTDQLQTVLAHARAASRAKSVFLANISHEIRTPMNGVIGLVDVVLDGELTAEQRQCLSLARRSAESLLTLINDLLDVSKIEAGRLEIEREPFVLRAALDDAAQILALQARPKGLAFSFEIAAEVPAVVIGDAARLRQVVFNLGSNAIKFTARGSVGIRIDARQRDRDAVLLEIVVTDTGIGIPADKQAIIFDAFTQADSSTARRFGGTGLGLSICAKLAEMMDGRIWLESREGMGSTFHVTARLGIGSSTQVGSAEQRPAAKLSGPAQRPLEVLVAEDNPVNQTLVERILSRRGHRVVLVGDGAAALAELERRTFDVVLMDVQMPNMDGLEATDAVRRREGASGRHVPIVALTANAIQGDRERYLQAGMDAYLSKPFTAAELCAVVERLAERAAPSVVPARPRLAEVLDWQNVMERTGGDQDLVRLMVDQFLEVAPPQLKQIDAALAEGDADAVQRLAHTLRGAAANIGLRPMSEDALRAEIGARRGDLSEARAAAARLSEQLARLYEAATEAAGR